MQNDIQHGEKGSPRCNSEPSWEAYRRATLTTPQNTVAVAQEDQLPLAGFSSPADQSARAIALRMRRESAANFLGELVPGYHLFALTGGQFSLVDVLEHVLEQLGPSSLTLSTWTANHADCSRMGRLIQSGQLRRPRFLFDSTFRARQPSLFAQITETFGTDAVRVARTHAKFALFESQRGRRRFVLRTSMNLNTNRRLEDLDLAEDPALHNFLAGIIDDFWHATDHQTQARKNQTEHENDVPKFETGWRPDGKQSGRGLQRVDPRRQRPRDNSQGPGQPLPQQRPQKGDGRGAATVRARRRANR